MHTRSLQYALLALIVLHTWAFLRVREKPLSGYADFAAYYGAGKAVQGGAAHGLYQYETQRRTQAPLFAPVATLGPLLYFHPPFEALLFWALAHTPYGIAYCLWTLANIALLAALPLLLRPYIPALDRASRGALPFSFLAFFPAYLVVVEGQDTLLLALIFLLAFISLKQGRECRAGCLLAAGLFKYQFVLPVAVLFLLRKRWRFLGGFTAMAAVLFAVSLALVGFRGLLDYPVFLWQVNQGLKMHAVQYLRTIHPASLPNLRGVCFGLLTGLVSERYIQLATLVASAAVFGWWAKRSSVPNRFAAAPPGAQSASAPAMRRMAASSDLDLLFSVDMCVAFLTSYHAYVYDMVLLWLPIVLVSNHMLEAKSPLSARWRLGTLAATFFFTPLYLKLDNPQRLYLMFIPVVLFALGAGAELRRIEGGHKVRPYNAAA